MKIIIMTDEHQKSQDILDGKFQSVTIVPTDDYDQLLSEAKAIRQWQCIVVRDGIIKARD